LVPSRYAGLVVDVIRSVSDHTCVLLLFASEDGYRAALNSYA